MSPTTKEPQPASDHLPDLVGLRAMARQIIQCTEASEAEDLHALTQRIVSLALRLERDCQQFVRRKKPAQTPARETTEGKTPCPPKPTNSQS